MALIKKSSKTRVCVVGLDGLPYSLLVDLASRGKTPALAELIGSGHLHRLKASLPEVSAVSWTDFMTGANSGTHGIFGFTDLKPGSYVLRFPNFLEVKKETIWETLGKQGKRSVIINQPSTYPARPLNGILVSGFVAIDPAKAIYPLSHKAALDRMGYLIDIDTLRAREDHSFLWQELRKTLAGREKALSYFWKEEWDYLEFVITGTDRLHHFLWNAYADENQEYHQNFLDYYREIDGVIGRLVHSFRELTGGEEGLYLLSDHGFCGIEEEVYLNAWLQKEGYLRFAADAPQSLEEIAPESVAFALDPSRIYLNTKGRFPKGSVAETDRPALLREISRKLEQLEFNGTKVIRRVFEANDVYSGPYISAGPDLLVLSELGFDLKGSVKKKDVFGRTDLQGMHTWDDAFFWAPTKLGDDLAISGLAPYILRHYQ
ncbi:MAG: alkaline phosphatase family protein [Acidobacteriota bacterium]